MREQRNRPTDGTTDDRSTPSAVTRRRFLASSTLVATATAGCLGEGNESDDGTQRPGAIENGGGTVDPRVDDPPNAVYKPSHVESVEMLDTVHAGDFALLPHYTYPHEFWLMRGGERESVSPIADGLHFMLAFWDAETGKMLPVDAGQRMEMRRDGNIVQAPFQPWPMISQRMGFHFGDNVSFPEEGTYTIEVQMGPVDVRKTGSFAGRFEEAVSTTFEFEYTQQLQVEAVEGVSYLEEAEWGQPGAVSPMGHGMGGGGMDGPPGPGLPSAEEYPGRDLGTHTSDDAVFVVRYLEDSRLADGGGYLFVSARTPYNRIPLPGMALAVEGDVEGTLTQTLDGELGHHYGRAVTLDAGDTFDIVTQTPPQVARHRGYETAFLDVDPIPVEVP